MAIRDLIPWNRGRDLTVHQRKVQAELGGQPVRQGHQRQPEEFPACLPYGDEPARAAEFGHQKSTGNLSDCRKRFKPGRCRPCFGPGYPGRSGDEILTM